MPEERLDRQDVSDVLSLLARERELLEVVLFTVEQQGPLLEDGAVSALRANVAEVADLLDELRHVELLRAMAVAALDLGPDPTLLDVAAACGGALGRMVCHHHTALIAMGAELAQAAKDNGVLLVRAVAKTPALQPVAGDATRGSDDLLPRSLRDFLRDRP